MHYPQSLVVFNKTLHCNRLAAEILHSQRPQEVKENNIELIIYLFLFIYSVGCTIPSRKKKKKKSALKQQSVKL